MTEGIREILRTQQMSTLVYNGILSECDRIDAASRESLREKLLVAMVAGNDGIPPDDDDFEKTVREETQVALRAIDIIVEEFHATRPS